jgi:regulator of sigma E protease
MNFLHTVVAFLVALGPLIIFHELGHYLVARACGVKVLRFSLGIGKVVWMRKFGRDQTEWAISMLPLGGYVKMLDNRDPNTAVTDPRDAQREFTSKSVWKRIAIVAAGPLANFLMAILIFAGLYMHGMQEPVARLRFMPETTAAYQAGLRGGDKVTSVNGKEIASFSELRMALIDAVLEKSEVRMEVVQPGGGRVTAYFDAATMGKLDVESDFLGALGLSVQRPPARVGAVLPGGPAEQAGLRKGDVIATVDGKPAADDLVVRQAIGASNGRTLQLGVLREGAELLLKVTPELDAQAKAPRIKAELGAAPEMVTVSEGPLGAVAKGARATWDSAAMQLRMIGKMLTGEISLKNVTGPITIADYAGQTAKSGAVVFLSFIALISVSLGVMNLLPIPVLDGGLLLYYSLEVLTGRPLPDRVGEYAQRAGVGILLMLMALAVFNDVARLLS